MPWIGRCSGNPFFAAIQTKVTTDRLRVETTDVIFGGF